MASKLCPRCCRALIRKQKSILRPSRTFTTTLQCYVELPEPIAARATSTPPITSKTDPRSVPPAKQPPMTKVAAELRRVTGRATETYSIYGVTEALIKHCSAQADYSIPRPSSSPEFTMPKTPSGEDLGVGSTYWHASLGLQPTFSTWSQIAMLHMYMLLTRFRCFDAAESKMWQQHLVDHFFHDAENRMAVSHGMHARGTRNGYLKDLFVQWRGLMAAYDEGVVRGDMVLAAALWRNVFKGDEEVDVKKIATVVSYLRRTLRGLEGVSDEAIRNGDIVFGDPGVEAGLVGQKSPMMNLPFKDANVVNELART